MMRLYYKIPSTACAKLTVASLLCLTLNSCSRDISDLENFVAETKTKYVGSIEPIPEFDPYQIFNYTAFEERDPFLQKERDDLDQQIAAQSGTQPDQQRRKEPLEYFPMDALSMVGILEQRGSVWGLIRDSDGTIHTVKPGNFLGENFGEIIRITESEIEILEIISDGLGAWIEREISLSLGE